MELMKAAKQLYACTKRQEMEPGTATRRRSTTRDDSLGMHSVSLLDLDASAVESTTGYPVHAIDVIQR